MQKEAPIEVRPEAIRKLFLALDSGSRDSSFDNRIQLEEIIDFIQKNEVYKIPLDKVEEMYQHAMIGRPIKQEKNREDPLT